MNTRIKATILTVIAVSALGLTACSKSTTPAPPASTPPAASSPAAQGQDESTEPSMESSAEGDPSASAS